MDTKALTQYISETKQRLWDMTDHEGKRVVPSGRPLASKEWDWDEMGQVQFATTNIMVLCYGEEHVSTKRFLLKLQKSDSWHAIAPILHAQLLSIEAELRHGLVGDLQARISSEIFGDFVRLSKEVLTESKDVAAVLVCAALEDALKRLATAKGLDVYDKDMSEVVNALKRSSVLKGAQSTLIGSYVTMRNRAFHAQWDKIVSTDVSSAIAFTERLLLENFG